MGLISRSGNRYLARRYDVKKLQNKKATHAFTRMSGFLVDVIIVATHPPACNIG
jgi:hypothetical protein